MRWLLGSWLCTGFIYPMLLTLGFSVYAFATDQPLIEVITSDAYPVTGVQSLQRQGRVVKVYNLDDGLRLVSQVTANLAGTEAAAKKTLQQRLKKMSDATVKNRFMQTYQGLMIGTQYGLSRYPAVVFNQGQSVVYGITDIPLALTLYRQWTATE